MKRFTLKQAITPLWAALLIVAAAACGGNADASSNDCPAGVTQQDVDAASQKAEASAGSPSGDADREDADKLAECLQAQDAGSDGVASAISTVPPAESQADLKELCKDFEDDSSYLKQLPGPTPGSAGAAFTSSDKKADVIGSTVAGIVTDFVATPVAAAHWGEIDRGAILSSTDPQAPADTVASAMKLRKDEAARKTACENLALELSNAFGDDTVVEVLTPSMAEKRKITQLAFWVYDPKYQESGWLCGQAIPPDGIKLVSWKRSFQENDENLPLGDTVTISVDRRELVAFKCPGAAFTGTQEGPEQAVTPESTLPKLDESSTEDESSADEESKDDTPKVEDKTSKGDDSSADDSSSDDDGATVVKTPAGGKGDTGTGSGGSGNGGGQDSGCGGSCGTDNGGTCTTDCGGGNTCTTNCGGTCTVDCGGDCTTNCGGGTTSTTSPGCNNCTTTTTVPVTTTTVVTTTTTPTTTVPTTTTTVAKGPDPGCQPWMPPGTCTPSG